MRLEPLLHPVGPLPAALYWRRRAAVLLLVVVLALVLAVVLARLLGGGEDRLEPSPPGATPTPAASPAAGPSPTPPGPSPGATAGRSPSGPSPGATAGPTPGESSSARALATASGSGEADEQEGTAVPAAAEPPPCDADDVRVEVAVSPAVAEAGEPVVFAARAAAVGDPCRLDAGPVARSAEVTAGAERVWSTEDCEAGSASEPVVLRPGEPVEITVRWEGERTAPGCPGGLPAPAAGEHRVVVVVGPASSEGVPFRLT